MNRVTLLLLAAVAMTASRPAMSQVLTAPSSQSTKVITAPPESRLEIYGSVQPDPLLRYRLWPAPADRIEENAVVLISRAVILQLQVSRKTKQQFLDNFNTWMNMPLAELPKQDVHDLLARYDSALREVDRAQDLMQINYPLQLCLLYTSDAADDSSVV